MEEKKRQQKRWLAHMMLGRTLAWCWIWTWYLWSVWKKRKKMRRRKMKQRWRDSVGLNPWTVIALLMQQRVP